MGEKLASSGGSHTYYNPPASKLLAGAKWSISYGDGSSAGGTVYKDTVKIGGVTVTSQAVEAATSAAAAFTSGANDGLVGLAFDSINTVTPTAQKTFFSNAITQGLPLAVMGADLKYHAAGAYDFGFIDAARHTGSVTYTPIDNSQGFWMFTPTGYSVGTASVRSPGATVMTGIADTGTTLMLVDSTIVTAYYAQVTGSSYNNAQGGYVFPCTAKLPDFTLVVNGYKAVVPGKYMNYAPTTAAGTTCYGGLQANTGVGFSIYGDVFLKSQYVIFDRSQSTPRIGFAPQAA